MTYIQYTYNCTYTIYIHYINTVAYARYCQVQYPTGIVSFYYFYSPKGNKSFKCKTGSVFSRPINRVLVQFLNIFQFMN